MKKVFLFFLVIIFFFCVYFIYTKDMQVKSPAFNNNETIPKKYTCDGENISPPLLLDNVPENTVSLVLIVDDPDAPVGVWNHWVHFNIPPNIREIPENANLEGINGKNSSGNLKYDGPCPPSGVHKYRFFVYALDSELDLKEGASKDEVLKAMQNHVLDQTVLIGKYSR